MSTGIVCGRILDAAKSPVSCRVVLGAITHNERIYPLGMQADGLRLRGRTTRTGCPPYNIAAETNADGTYALIYDFAEDFAGEIATSLRFSVTCYDHNDRQYRCLGSGRGIGIYGLDLRSMLSQALSLPLDPAGFGFWTNLIVAAQRAAPSRWERQHTTEGTERRPRHERGIPLTPQGAPRTTPPGPVPRPPPAQGPQPMQRRGGGAFAQGALGESVGGGRYMLLTKIDVRLGPKGQELAREGPIGGWPR